MEFVNLENALDKYGEAFIQGYRKRLDEGDINASGDLSNSLKVRVENKGQVYEVILSLMDYWKYIEYGRKPGGRFPPYSAIERWIKVKPVLPRAYKGRVPTEKQLIYLISRKIAVEGIEPKPILAQTKEDTYAEAIDIIRKAFLEDLKGDLDEVILMFKTM